MARVGNRGETHAWFDGEFWSLYTERGADIRRFTEWFGAPTRVGTARECAHWDRIPKDSLRVGRRRKAKRGATDTVNKGILAINAARATRARG